MTVFAELKRRNVFRVGVAYILGAWVLLQGIDFALDAISAPNWILQVFILAAFAGFPIVLIVSWVFEITPEGVKRERDINRSESTTPSTGNKLDRVIIAFLALAVVILLADRFLGEPSDVRSPDTARVSDPVNETGDPSQIDQSPTIGESKKTSHPAFAANTIAVLPFVNMSSDKEQEYFSDGITEEILNRLASIQELQVAARTSVFSFKGQNEDIREIARKLGVGTILEGSVRKAGDQVRVTAQLIRAEDGFHLWSESFDHTLENVFAIQDEIASRIAESLQVSMGVNTQARQVNPEVYDLYLRARALHRQRGDGLTQAIDLFKQALTIDPEFAPAWAGLSHTYIVWPNYVSMEELNAAGDVLGKSLDAAQRALELDPNLPTAIHAMANNLFFRFEWAEAEAYYLKALELDPDSADIMEDYASLLSASVQLEKSLTVAERMIALDPYVPVFHNTLITTYELQGEDALVEKHLRIALEINPDMSNIQTVNLMRLMTLGQFDEARQYATGMNQRVHDLEGILQTIDWVEAGGKGTPSPELSTYLDANPHLSFLGDRYDLWIEATEKLGNVWPEWELTSLFQLVEPNSDQDKLHRFRSDPRTKAYLERVRLPGYWRQVGWPEFCRPLGPNDFECS